MSHSDHDWSKRLGEASLLVMFHLLDQLLKVRTGVILESNFHSMTDGARIAAISAQYNVQIVELHCTAREDIIEDRFLNRLAGTSRHPGHAEKTDRETFPPGFLKPHNHAALEIGTTHKIETSDFSQVAYDAILSTVLSDLSETQ